MPTMTRTVALSAALHAAALALCLAAGGGGAVYAPSPPGERVIAVRLGGGDGRAGAESPAPAAPPPPALVQPKAAYAAPPPPSPAAEPAPMPHAPVLPAAAASEQPARSEAAHPGDGASGPPDARPTEGEASGAPRAAASAEPTAEYLTAIRGAVERVLAYPPLARRRGWEGTVVASFFIDGRGIPSEIRVTRGSGYGVLDRETLAVIERASPYPPLGGRVELPVSFRLNTP